MCSKDWMTGWYGADEFLAFSDCVKNNNENGWLQENVFVVQKMLCNSLVITRTHVPRCTARFASPLLLLLVVVEVLPSLCSLFLFYRCSVLVLFVHSVSGIAGNERSKKYLFSVYGSMPKRCSPARWIRGCEWSEMAMRFVEQSI